MSSNDLKPLSDEDYFRRAGDRLKSRISRPPAVVPNAAQGEPALRRLDSRDKIPILSREEMRLWDEDFRRIILENAKNRQADGKASAAVIREAPGRPAASVPTVRKKKASPPILQEEEMQRFFDVIDSRRDRAIFRLMYHAGLRASEIGLLEIRDYTPTRTGSWFTVEGLQLGRTPFVQRRSRGAEHMAKGTRHRAGCDL